MTTRAAAGTAICCDLCLNVLNANTAANSTRTETHHFKVCRSSASSEGQIGPIAGHARGLIQRGAGSRPRPRSPCAIQLPQQRPDLSLRSPQGVAELRGPGQRAGVIQFARDAMQFIGEGLQTAIPKAGYAP